MLLGLIYHKIEVVRKVGLFVLKRSAFEPRSQRNNQKEDPKSSDREIVEKLSKNLYYENLAQFRQFFDDFLARSSWIFFGITALRSWFKCASFDYKESYFPDNFNFDL